MNVSIYVLIDPRSGEIRYVGQTRRSLSIRLREHVQGRRWCRRMAWLTVLRRQEVTPVIRLVQQVPIAAVDEAERYWIAYFRGIGCALVNSTDGGDGCSGHSMSDEGRSKIAVANSRRIWSEESKARCRSAHLGKAMPEGTGAKISAAKMGHVVSEEARAKMSATKKGRRLSMEARAKMSAARKGRPGHPLSAEARAKISAARRGTTLSVETRAKVSAAGKGRKFTLEHKERIKAALLGYHQRKRENGASIIR